MKNLYIAMIVFFIVGVGLIIGGLKWLGAPENWVDMEGFGSVLAAYLVLVTVYFLIKNWVKMKEQNDELKQQTKEIKSQTQDMKRATDAQVFKTVIDILQAQDIRESRKWVLENTFDNPIKRNDLTKWELKDILEAEKVGNTFDSAALLAVNGILQHNLLGEWGDPIMKCWASIQKLADHYIETRGVNDPYPHFRKFAKEYIDKQYDVLTSMKIGDNSEVIQKRAQVVAECLLQMNDPDRSNRIRDNFNIQG